MISGGPAAASPSRERGRATRLDRLCYKRWAAPLRPLASAHHSTCRPPVMLHPLSAYATFGRRRCYRRRRRLLRPAGGAATSGRRCRRKRRGRLLRPAGGAAANSGGACFVRPAALLPNAGDSAASGGAYYIRSYQRPAALLQAAAAPATSGHRRCYKWRRCPLLSSVGGATIVVDTSEVSHRSRPTRALLPWVAGVAALGICSI
jgi:hypothetical protein